MCKVAGSEALYIKGEKTRKNYKYYSQSPSQDRQPKKNGRLERMSRIIKSAVTYRYFYSSNLQLRQHLNSFLNIFTKRLKTLNGKTPYEFILSFWTKEATRFIIKPIHHIMKPNSYGKIHQILFPFKIKLKPLKGNV